MKSQILLFISSFFFILPVFAEYDIDNNIDSLYDAIKENCYVEITEDNIKGIVRVEGNVLSQCINHALISVQFSLVDAYNNKINEKAELIKDCKKNLYRDFYLSSYFIQKTKIETVYINNQYVISISLNVALKEFESFRDYYEKEPYNDTLFSNLYKSNIDFRTFVSRKLIEIK